MMILQQELKRYIKEHGVKTTCDRSGLSDQTIRNILHGNRPSKRSVDILYKFLKLEVDQRYIENLSTWYGKWFWVGGVIKSIRINMGLDQVQFAHLIWVNKRTLQRIETENQVPKWEVCKAISNLLLNFLLNKS